MRKHEKGGVGTEGLINKTYCKVMKHIFLSQKTFSFLEIFSKLAKTTSLIDLR